MNEGEFLNRLENLQMWKRYDVRAPHKPLLLLLALTRLVTDGSRFLTYQEVEPVLTSLLVDFGPKRQSHNPQEPFRRLVNDGLWDRTELQFSRDCQPTEATHHRR